jgi:starch synthase
MIIIRVWYHSCLHHSKLYTRLANVPTVFTIHNGQYHGAFGWDKLSYLPEIDLTKTGLLDWAGGINPLAAAVKCAGNIPPYRQVIWRN